MKAMVCEAFGGPEVLALREVPDPPPPGPGEITVRIAARSVQYVDVLMLAGKYQFRPDPPFIPGGEAAGKVIAVGPDITGFKQGDLVMSRHTLGACAELGNAKAALCDRVPAGMSSAMSPQPSPPHRSRPARPACGWPCKRPPCCGGRSVQKEREEVDLNRPRGKVRRGNGWSRPTAITRASDTARTQSGEPGGDRSGRRDLRRAGPGLRHRARSRT
jgi:hypothetical protein